MRKTLALGIVMIFVGAVTLVYLMSLLLIKPNFQWEVEVGDEFLYEVKVQGFSNRSSVPFVEFNNTQIRMRIVSLPDANQIDNPDEMLAILGHQKTECEFITGSSIPIGSRYGYYLDASLAEILSRGILPIGGWDYIDSYFPDEYKIGEHIRGEYLSKIDEQWFYIGYHYWYIDYSYGWNANVNMTTGSPISVCQWEDELMTGLQGQYSVTLSLVELD